MFFMKKTFSNKIGLNFKKFKLIKLKKKIFIFGEILLSINPKEDKIIYALNKIVGIGIWKSLYIMSTFGLGKNCKFFLLSSLKFEILSKFINVEYLVGDFLKRKLIKNLQNFIENNSLKGKFILMNLPLNGQRTHTNARTCKKIILLVLKK